MSKPMLILLIVLLVIIGLIVVLYFVGRKLQKKQAQNEEILHANRQVVSMLVIDKQKVKMKDSKLPQYVIDQTPKMYRRAKVCIVKAKIGPKIMSFMCDLKVYNQIPLKTEIKAGISGLYILDVTGARGQALESQEEPKGFRAKRKARKLQKKQEEQERKDREEKARKKAEVKKRQEENRRKMKEKLEQEKIEQEKLAEAEKNDKKKTKRRR